MFGRIFYPIRDNVTFFVFMYLLGTICTLSTVPDTGNAHPYELWAIELLLDVYLICLVLTAIPNKIRRWIKYFIYIILYATAIVDVFCFVKFQSTLTPTMLLLVSETDSREAGEFFSSYLGSDVIFSGIGWILLLIMLHLTVAFIPKMRRRLGIKTNMLINAAAETMKKADTALGIVTAALLVYGAAVCTPNKIAMYNLMTKNNIGEVEHELTKHDSAKLYLPIYRLAFSIYSNSLAQQQITKLIEAKDNVEVDSCSYRSTNIILIIGESYNKRHSQLYGYDKQTTPRQLERERKGELIKFSDVIAPWNLTSFVFKLVLSMQVVGEKGEWCDYPMFPQLFRKAGYRVAFITNQFLPKAKEAVYDFSGGFFINNSELSKAQFDTRNTSLHRYDDGIIRDFDKFVDDGKIKFGSTDNSSVKHSGVNNLIIFHVKGQHVTYNTRYPKEQRRFFADDYDRPDLNKKKRDILSHYDNAVLYNDSIVDQIIRRFEDKDAIVIYMPDHGEECFDDGFQYFGRNHSAEITPQLAHNEFDIPFWIWCSHRYAVSHPDIYHEIIEAKDRRMMTDALPHLMLYLAGIHAKDYRAEHNILSGEYNEKRPRVIKGKVDYDKLMMKQKR